MTNTETICAEVEVRESSDKDGPRLTGVLLIEGRAARGGRAELFAPHSLEWSSDGIPLRTVHLGPEVSRMIPTRHPDGSIKVSARATAEIREAIAAGKRYLSVEFHALKETPDGCACS